MLFGLWRWKPRLVWLVMHAATLGLLWCSRAGPTQAQFGALLATTTALYVSISFVDPGYVELVPASALAPDRASLSALSVPLVLQACHPTLTSADLGCYRPLARHASSPRTYSTYVVQYTHLVCTRQACDMCRVDKPARAKHCYDCGRCVRRMDHPK